MRRNRNLPDEMSRRWSCQHKAQLFPRSDDDAGDDDSCSC